jgi:hypothetical protein
MSFPPLSPAVLPFGSDFNRFTSLFRATTRAAPISATVLSNSDSRACRREQEVGRVKNLIHADTRNVTNLSLSQLPSMHRQRGIKSILGLSFSLHSIISSL